MNKDQLLLSEAYGQIYNEGIIDRVKGQFSGMGAGLKQGAQNLVGKAAGALGAEVKTSGQTMGQSYAKAQQTSLLKSFIAKANKEINDFFNDLNKMGAGADVEAIRKTHPAIADKIDKVKNLSSYLEKQASGGGSAPAKPEAAAPEAEKPALPASTESGTGPLAKIPEVGGQAGAKPGFENAKNITPSGNDEPVQKAYNPPASQEGEVVDNNVKGYLGAAKQQYGAPTQKPENGTIKNLNGQLFRWDGNGYVPYNEKSGKFGGSVIGINSPQGKEINKAPAGEAPQAPAAAKPAKPAAKPAAKKKPAPKKKQSSNDDKMEKQMRGEYYQD
jgi:hypothetical protein